MTHRTTPPVSFCSVRRRELVAEFTAGHITSDAGLLLLREADRQIGRGARRGHPTKELALQYQISGGSEQAKAMRAEVAALSKTLLQDE